MIGYAVAVALVALGTASAVAPFQRPHPLAKASWRAGYLVNEAPVLPLVYVVGSSWLAVSDGVARTPVGAALLVVAAGSAAGLGVVARRAGRARPALEAALSGTVDPSAPRSSPARRAGRMLPRPRGVALAAGHLLPVPFRPRSVERVGDVPYGPHPRQRLDLYRRRSGADGAPVLVYLHGGGFRSGSRRREGRALLNRMAAAGWVCVSAGYRLAPEVTLLDQVADVARVVAWVRRDGPAYGADPTRVVLAGSSAGAALASALVFRPGAGPGDATGTGVDASVSAVVALYGYYGVVDATAGRSGPSRRVPRPPFMVVHGALDSMVPAHAARAFVDGLRADSPEVVVHAELPGAQHTFDVLASVRSRAVVDAVEAFATWAVDR